MKMIHCLIKLVKLFNIFFLFLLLTLSAESRERVTIGATTSIYDSGLVKYLEKYFEEKFNYSLDFVIKGTGQLLEVAKRGDLDLLIVHHKESEDEFINTVSGSKKYKLMHNNFIIVGPIDDPADVENTTNITEVMSKIYESSATFVSRGDNSGTYFKELNLWENAELDPNNFGNWYVKIGQGMGATINISNNLRGYTVSDEATWHNFKNKNNLRILFKGDEGMSNQYNILIMSPHQYDYIKIEWINNFLEWILSPEGKKLINNYRIGGHQLFYFNGDQYISE